MPEKFPSSSDDPHGVYFDLILEKAYSFFGSTSPNPPVGALVTDKSGEVLAIGAHERAGELHAEAKVIEQLRQTGQINKAHTLYVTLEPCNHTGRTPPCAGAILSTPIRQVYMGVKDPNGKATGGAEFLRENGIHAEFVESRKKECEALIAPFTKWIRMGIPYVVLKTAHRSGSGIGFTPESMAPPKGVKTFTSHESLRRVHEWRRGSDAILTTASTINIDQPEFTVRHLEDFPGKKRFLSIFDRKNEVDESYFDLAHSRGFIPHRASSLLEELRFLGSQGVHQVLIEAGPRFSRMVFDSNLWDEHIQVIQGEPDLIKRISRS
jgi:diaminohydroxyphosphoribosylaminopyrimidine deaminase / 5-amino-6-(5-phosphoribosylamino)uracil reductase